jgi:hypothetical protein
MKILTGANRPDSGKIILDDFFEIAAVIGATDLGHTMGDVFGQHKY